MAGGQGTRLWPESRKERPKQFLALKDGRPLILEAAESLDGLVARERVFVVTGEAMTPLVREAIPWLPERNILIEPIGRNTAPCIGLAAIHLLRHDPDAVMVVLSADHWIEPLSVFCDTVRFAVDLVEESPERLVTLAVKPTCAATSYGYIERAEKIYSNCCKKWSHFAPAYQVTRFHEKPDRQTAEQFVESGRFGWNAGIFVWRADRILDWIAKFQPDMGNRLEKIANALDTETYNSVLAQEFQQIQAISIDYAVLEKADSLVCIDAPFRWDDVGTWQALDRIHQGKHDSAGNLIENARVVAVHSHNNIVRGTNPHKDIVLVGVDNLIIVQSEHGTLIADKSQEEAIRQAIAKLEHV
jgi:mannose-1-phosphate guanylyltransferase